MYDKLTEKERIMFEKYYSLTKKDFQNIRDMKNDRGMTIDEIARKYEITPPDVNRILHPNFGYGKYTAEEKLKHWIAGQRRAQTVKRQREESLKKIKVWHI